MESGARITKAIALSSMMVTLSACGSTSSPTRATDYGPKLLPMSKQSAPRPRVASRAAMPGSYLQHVVIVVQENRSFDNIFAGFPGADTQSFGYEHNGTMVPLRPTTFNAPDMNHVFGQGLRDWNHGAMNGFDQTNLHTGGLAGSSIYAFLRRDLVEPYWTMARRYVLADHMFPTEWGPSFSAHIDLIAGSASIDPTHVLADLPTETPWGCDAPAGTLTTIVGSNQVTNINGGPFPCFNFETMADTLDAAGVPWKYYAPKLSNYAGSIWTPFDAIGGVRYGADWANVTSPETTVLTDAAAGNLPAVSWVVPDYQNSDHAGSGSSTGPSWVASIVNSIGSGPDWKSTAIIVVWDDWGGWYDNVSPPQLDFIGLGIRVPCIIISPYAKSHYVAHTQYEFGSILKFVEETFGVASLGTTDARASSLDDAFDFTQPARSFDSVPAPYSRSYILHRKPSHKPPDDE